MGEFANAISRSSQPWKKNGRILKIVLFGSYSRDDWVDEPTNGYQSDFDLLIIVSHEDLTEIADYWFAAEDKISRDADIARPVNIIVHTLDQVNQALSRGEYFWADIARDGIVLHELSGSALATPMPLTTADGFKMAQAYHSDWLEKVDSAQKLAAFALSERQLKDAAFLLHQAVERAYICYLLVRTLYFPRSHNVKFLRSLAEDKEPRLIAAWPRETRADRRRFELVKRAYVEARYSASYEITTDDLTEIAKSVATLRNLVSEVSQEWLHKLQTDAGR